jgi:DNA-binding transcriptional MerR regulator
MSERTWTIGELAEEFDTTLRTIRFYEDRGLLAPERQGTTRTRSPT